MPDDLTSQREAHQFFIDRLKDDRTFTKEEVMAVTGWDKSSADTYWSKQFKGFLDKVPGGFRMRENFRPYGTRPSGQPVAAWRSRHARPGRDSRLSAAAVCYHVLHGEATPTRRGGGA